VNPRWRTHAHQPNGFPLAQPDLTMNDSKRNRTLEQIMEDRKTLEAQIGQRAR